MVSAAKIDPRLPRYQKLRDAIVARIAAGEWSAGQAIPTEMELSQAYEVAIGTVRKAVDLLEQDGIVERSHGRGTYLRRPRFDASLFRFFRLLGPSGERPDPESRLLSREEVSPPTSVAETLLLGPGARALRLLRLRLVASSPLLFEEIWLGSERFGRLLSLDEVDIGPLLYPAYERHFGIVVARAQETLTVGLSNPEVAAYLKIGLREPVVQIERLAFDYGGNPIELRRSYGAASTFRYKIDVS